MKNAVLILLVLASFSTRAQRMLEDIYETDNKAFDLTTMGGHAYYVRDLGSYKLYRYDGSRTQEFYFPIKDDAHLRWYHNQNSALETLGTSVYLILTRVVLDVRQHYLYRFDGSAYFPVPVSGEVASGLEIFQSKIYFAARSGSAVNLYSFDGSSLQIITGTDFSFSSELYLAASETHLYIHEKGSDGNKLFRYNGETMVEMPRAFTFLGADYLHRVVQVPGSPDAFLIFNWHTILYFRSETILSRTNPVDFFQAATQLSHDKFAYVVTPAAEGIQYRLVSMTGVQTVLSPPPGHEFLRPGREFDPFSQGRLAVFEDDLIVATRSGDTGYVMRYDGTRFTTIFSGPITLFYHPSFVVRNNRLLMFLGDSEAYEYDGSSFTQIISPGAHYIDYRESTECFHAWAIERLDPVSGIILRLLSVERTDSKCVSPPPPPSSEPVSIIPEDIMRYEFMDIRGIVPEGWCDSELEVDWIVEPFCPVPPCDDLPFSAALHDKKNNNLWKQLLTKSGTLKIPNASQEPVTLELGVDEYSVTRPFIKFDHSLDDKGIENFNLRFFPPTESVYLSIQTKKEIKIPVSIGLFNEQGEVLWQKEIEAPFDGQLQGEAESMGAYLKFSLGTGQPNMTFYPNPAFGNIYIQIHSGKGTAALSDLNGNILLEKSLSAEVSSIDVSNFKAGLYILSIKNESGIRKELLQIK